MKWLSELDFDQQFTLVLIVLITCTTVGLTLCYCVYKYSEYLRFVHGGTN